MDIFLGLFFGCSLMVFLYNLHWYRLSKEKSYLYYACFQISMILVIAQTAEVLLIPPIFLILSINCVFILMLIFTKEFLDLKKNFKTLNSLINAALAFVILCLLYSFYTGDFSIYDQSYSLLFSPLILLGCWVYWSGFEPAKYYALGRGISLFLVGIYDLNRFGYLDFYSSIPFDNIGHIVQSIIFSYAIFAKTEFIIKEKEEQNKILVHQARLASMGQMIENISHQWRQPLNRISTYIINMQVHFQDGNKKNDEKYFLQALKESQLQLEYMSNTINDFTNFNRSSKDKNNFLASVVVSDVDNIIGQTLKSNSISFGIDLRDDFSIFSYQNELAQVILNLIQNSQDALLSRQIENPEIEVIIDKNRISVEDNAGGLEEGVLDQMFEPYFTTKSKSSSLGLGLYMSKIILEKYFNAHIQVRQAKQTLAFDILFDS